MEREIKFRVWDKDCKSMHICGENSHDSIIFIDNMACYYNLQNGCGSCHDDAYELMQYTGRKDNTVNKQEVYYDDVIEYITYPTIDDHLLKINPVTVRGQVGYSERYARYVLKDKRGSYLTCLGWAIEHCNGEVIGNIHENPELLEVKL